MIYFWNNDRARFRNLSSVEIAQPNAVFEQILKFINESENREVRLALLEIAV
jgi:hypothetical protein